MTGDHCTCHECQPDYGLMSPDEVRAIRLVDLAREAGELIADENRSTNQGPSTLSAFYFAVRDTYMENR